MISAVGRKSFQEAIRTGRFSSGEYRWGAVVKRYVMDFGYPVRDTSGEVAGVVGIVLDLNFAQRIFEKINSQPGGFFTILDHNGIGFIRYPPGELMAKLLGKRDRVEELFVRMQGGADEGTFRARDAGGEGRLFAYRRLTLPTEAKPYLYIRSSVPLASVISRANGAMMKNFALLTLVFGSGVVVVSLVGKRAIVKPVMMLKDASERLSTGTELLNVSGLVKDGELGQLARAFDGMAEALTQREAALRKSEERYRLLIETANEGIWSMDGSHGTTYVNQAMADMLGYTPSEMLGRKVEDFFFPEDMPFHESRMEIRHSGRDEVYQRRFRRKDGSALWTLVSAKALRDSEGRFSGSFAMFTDITEQKRSAEELRASERRYRTLFNQATEGIALADFDTGILVDCNQAFLNMTGYARADLVGMPEIMLHPPEPGNPRMSRSFLLHRSTMEGQILADRLLTKDGAIRDVEIKTDVVEVDGAKLMQGFFRDVTAELRGRKEKETTLTILKLLNDREHTRELIVSLTGFLQEWTGCGAVGIRLRDGDDFPYYETRGFPRQFVEAENYLCARDLQGQLLRDTMGNPVLECMCGNILSGRFDPRLPFFTERGSFWSNCTTDLLASTTEEERQTRTRNRCNREGYESVALIPLKYRGEILGLLQLNDQSKGRFTRDLISFLENACEQIAIALAQRKAQNALQLSEERFRGVSEAAGEYVFEVDPMGRITFISDRVRDVLGYAPEEILGRTPFDFLPPSEVSRTRPFFEDHVRTRTGFRDLEHQALAGSGRMIWLSATLVPIFDRSGALLGYRGAAMDVTTRKEAEQTLRESEEKHRTLFENMVQGVFYQRADGALTDANTAALDIFGLTLDEFLGRTSCDPDWKVTDQEGKCIPGTEHPSVVALRTGKAVRNVVLAVHNRRKDSFVWVNVNAIPQFRPGEDRPYQVFVTLHDVSERREAEERVVASLREKEVLLREIHHRVKNNLQVISSLLRMQSEYIRAPEDVGPFRASMDRIKSMALIHDKLYRSLTLASVSLPDYIRDLAGGLLATYALEGGIEMELDVAPLSLEIDDAIPVGLILNELVSNAVKHAFSEGAGGMVGIRAEAKDGEIRLTISDNGAGFPEDLDFRDTPSLGMQLVVTLVEQLEGTIELNRSGGTEFRITFPDRG